MIWFMLLEVSHTKSRWRRLALSLSVALAACLLVRPALAQTPTIEELEKRIEEAKKAKEAMQQAQAESKRQQGQADAALAAKQGTLVIGNDAPCSLTIDMERVEKALPVGARELSVQGGERLIECTSTEQPTISVSRVVNVKAGDKTFLQFRLKDKVAAASQRKSVAGGAPADAGLQGSAAVPAPAPGSKGRRFDELGDGLLRDHRTGLVWSASDNGADINWDDAARYCNHRGMLLPTVGQLQSLVDRGGTMTTPCQGKQCKVSERFHLTGYRFWSKQQEGERWALFVSLNNGRRNFDHAGVRDNFRALCVRGT